MRWRSILAWVAIGMAVVAVAIQLVPYGWRHPNPPVTATVAWPSAEAERIARAACYDCHSNETVWPVYSYVAPMSWLVRYDVERGREELNFSEWDREQEEADDAAETVEDGSMPPRQYEVLHADARLSVEEQRILIEALQAVIGESDREHGEDDDD